MSTMTYNPPVVVTPAVAEPITLAQLKTFLRVDHTSDDTELAGMLRAARGEVEDITGRALLTSTWDVYYQEWPSGEYFELPKAPLQSVTSVKYTDSAGTETTWGAANYDVDTYSEPGRVALAYNISWPTATLAPTNPIVIRIVAGYTRHSSTVTVATLAVSKTAGDSFDTAWTAERPITINGADSLISAVASATDLTVTTAPGDGTGLACSLNDMPSELRQAIYLKASMLYHGRDQIKDTAYFNLLQNHRIYI